MTIYRETVTLYHAQGPMTVLVIVVLCDHEGCASRVVSDTPAGALREAGHKGWSGWYCPTHRDEDV